MKPKIWKIWIGENPIPEQFKQYTDTWSKIKGAEVVEVTNENVQQYLPYYLDFKTIIDRFRGNNTLINHWLRYWLMYQYGGIYLDLDVEVIKDSEVWYDDQRTFFAETTNPLWINNHVMVCNSIHDDVYYNLSNLVWFHDMNDPKVEINTGPGLVTEYIKQNQKYKFDTFNPEFTTPWNWNEEPDRSRITENTIAVHHFTHSWKK